MPEEGSDEVQGETRLFYFTSKIKLKIKCKDIGWMGRGQCEGEHRREISCEFVVDALKTKRGGQS